MLTHLLDHIHKSHSHTPRVSLDQVLYATNTAALFKKTTQSTFEAVHQGY